jgi:mRNA interferase YafQ
MRNFAFTNQFKKDLRLMEKRHRNMDAIYTECHVAPDWLMVYRCDEEKIVFYYTGTHSDLF